ncbi:MAG: hypothetical protein ACJAZP_002912 [Psychromonas sp.]|jgi:hypothetical protein
MCRSVLLTNLLFSYQSIDKQDPLLTLPLARHKSFEARKPQGYQTHGMKALLLF